MRREAGSSWRLRGLGESNLAAGRDEPAFAAFRDLAQSLEVGQDFGRDYWHAWTRLIEILARRNHDASRSADIRREIQRLGRLPSATDHPECIARLRAIEAALPSK